MHSNSDATKLTGIDLWGIGEWYDMYQAFSGFTNVTSTATDQPRFIGQINCGFMFLNATHFNGDLSNWDMSNVVGFDGLFWGASAFNSDIGNWNVSSVRRMNNMFEGAASFNQNLGAWDVSSVTN